MNILDYLNGIRQHFVENDVDGIARVLEAIGYFSDGSFARHTSERRGELCQFIGLGAAVADDPGFSEEVANVIINHVYGVVDIYEMLSFIIQHKKVKKPDYNRIPHNIRKALREGKYTDELGEQILGLTEEETEALIFYVADDEVEHLLTKYGAPLLKAAYRTISKGLFFAFLGISIRPPTDKDNKPNLRIVVDGKPIDCEIIPVVIDFSKICENDQEPEKAEEKPADEPEEGDGLKA